MVAPVFNARYFLGPAIECCWLVLPSWLRLAWKEIFLLNQKNAVNFRNTEKIYIHF